MTSQKDAIAKAPSGRVSRTPMGRRNILTVKGKEDGFEYRIVNDKNDRVSIFEEAGWEPVRDETVTIGDKRVEKASSVGSVRMMSVGGGDKGVLMRIPTEFYKEDQDAKQRLLAQQESYTKQKALDGTYGRLDISRD